MATHPVSLTLRISVVLVSLIATHIAASEKESETKTAIHGNDQTTVINDSGLMSQGESSNVQTNPENAVESMATTLSDDVTATIADVVITTVADDVIKTIADDTITTVYDDVITRVADDVITTMSDDVITRVADDVITTMSDDVITTMSDDVITIENNDATTTVNDNDVVLTTVAQNTQFSTDGGWMASTDGQFTDITSQKGLSELLTTPSSEGVNKSLTTNCDEVGNTLTTTSEGVDHNVQTSTPGDKVITTPYKPDTKLAATTTNVNEGLTPEVEHISFLVSTMDMYGVPTSLTPGKQAIEISCWAYTDGLNIVVVSRISLFRTRSDSFTVMTEIVSAIKTGNTSTIRWSDDTLQARRGVNAGADLTSNNCFLKFVIDFYDTRCEDAEEYRCVMSGRSTTGQLTAMSDIKRTILYPAVAPSYTDAIKVNDPGYINNRQQHEYPIGSKISLTCSGSVGSDRLRHKWHVSFPDDPCSTATAHLNTQHANSTITRDGCNNKGSSTALLIIPDVTQPIVVWCWVSSADTVAEDCDQFTDNNIVKSVTILPVTSTDPCDDQTLRSEITMTPHRKAYRQYEPLNLTCNYTGIQEQVWFFRRLPSEKWIALSHNQNKTQGTNSFTLSIPKVSLIHRGWYACTARDCSAGTSRANENQTVFVDVLYDHCRENGILIAGDTCVEVTSESSCAANNGTVASIHTEEKSKIIYGFAFHILLIETDVKLGLSLADNTVSWKNFLWTDGSPMTFRERLSKTICFICLEEYPADLAMTYGKTVGDLTWVVTSDHTYVACEWQEERPAKGLRIPQGILDYTGSKAMIRCTSGEYISSVYRCDGTPDCTDLSDESNCRKGCDEETFQCDYGDCIPVSKSCDFIKDCADGSDELLCNYPPCDEGFWQCANKECIPVYDVCDGDVECIDGSDESDAICIGNNGLPSEYTFRCFEPNRILPLARKCDGVQDCSDKLESDEISCSSLIPYYSCCSWAVTTSTGLSSDVAVDYGMPQYGKSDVQCFIADTKVHTIWKFSPEQDIAIPYHATSVVSDALWFETKWTSWQFQSVKYKSPFQQKVMLASSSSCIQYIRPCGYFIYIPGVVIEWENGDGDTFSMTIDDYEGCFGICTAIECSVQFTNNERHEKSEYFDGNEAFGWIPITNKQQLPVMSVRSSFVTIIGVSRLICSEDLHNNNTKPVTTYLKCKNEFHYDPALQCLMNFDLTGEPIACRDLTHLENCENFTCPEYYVKCPGSFCLHMRYICDGTSHCPNREDELDCKSPDCSDHYRCRGRQPCLPFTYLCDGVRQCPLGDDELHCDVTCPTGCSCKTLAFVCDSEIADIHLSNIPAMARSINIKTNLKNLRDNFPTSFPLLTTLILKSCNLQELRFRDQSIFKNMTALRHLDISSNYIQNFPENIFSDINDLRTLILSNNPFASISDGVLIGLKALRKLHISQTNIKDLHKDVFAELSLLEYLDLSSNLISSLPNNIFSNLVTLQTLILSGNPIVSIDDNAFSKLFSISSLHLSNINSEQILSGVFGGLQSLTILNLSSSGIHNLGLRTFQDLTNLEKLDIRNNYFEVQEFMFDGLDNLQYLYADTYKMCCIKPKSVLDNNCVAPEDFISSCSNLIGSDFLKTCLWIIGLLAVVGNIFVIIYRLVIDKRNVKKSQSIFVINLSISDLIMGIYMIIIAAVDTHFSGNYVVHDTNWRQGTLCVTAGCLSVISSEMSTFAILLITIDRFIAIVFPLSLRKITWRTAVVLCAMFWIVSVILAIVPHTTFPGYFKGEFYSRSGVCLALPLTAKHVSGHEYSVAVFIGLNGLLFLLILIAQICIHRNCKGSGSIAITRNRKQEIALARSLFFVVATDFFCWFPVGVIGMWSQLGGAVSADVYAWVMVFVLPINSAINPFLYTYFYIKRKADINVHSTIKKGKTLSWTVKKKRLTHEKGFNTSDIIKELYFCKYFKREKGSISLEKYALVSKMSPTQAYQIATGTIKALSFLHHRHAIHGNVSEKHVFISNTVEVVKRSSLMLEKSRIGGDHDSHTDILQYGLVIKILLSMLDRY